MLRQLFILAAGLVCTVAGGASAQQGIGDDEARALLVGNSVIFADYSVAKYDSDGRYTYVASNNLLFDGKYTISGGRLCLKLDDGSSRCDTLGRDSLGPYMATEKGNRLRFSVRNGIMPQHTAKLCNVPVAYNLFSPAADVPPDMRTFSGVWVGKWDYGLCAALIVESVQTTGTASLIYVNGALGGERSIRPGAARFQGIIVGSMLKNTVKDYYTEYLQTGPNVLEGHYSVPRSSARGRFVRQAQTE